MSWEKSSFGQRWIFWGHEWDIVIGDHNETSTTGHSWRYTSPAEAREHLAVVAQELREMADEMEAALKTMPETG